MGGNPLIPRQNRHWPRLAISHPGFAKKLGVPVIPSIDKRRAPSQAPEGARGNFENLSYDQIHNLCKERGYHKKDAEAVSKTRLEATDAVERRLITQNENTMDTSSSVFGKRDRFMVELSAVEPTQQQVEGKRSRGNVPAITTEVDLAAVQTHAQWWLPDL